MFANLVKITLFNDMLCKRKLQIYRAFDTRYQ